MSTLMWIDVALTGLNGILTLALAFVYARNHRQIRSPFTLGLLLFALFLALHNGVVLYHLLTMMTVFASLGEPLLLVENVLQAGALVFLLRATLR